jgi:DNA-binding CsgD family transcriptional regulator
MTGPARQLAGAGLLGREPECAAIDRLLEDARTGTGTALVVRGEAGIGKSALLGYARQQAPPMQLLSASGTEAESDLAFAGVHELLRPVLGYLGELPGTQSRALAGALGLAPSAQPDRLLIGAAVLGLLGVAAEDQPTLCLVDDAHWLDRPSADALVFAARRLQAEQLAILLGAREGEASRFEAAGLPELTLTGLDEQSAAAILASRVGQAPPSVRDRLLTEAAGNPLALLELSGGLSQEQLQGLVPLPDAMPLTPRLEGVFRQRAGQLPQAAQSALLIAAADNSGDAPTVLQAAAVLGLPAGALDAAENAALIQVRGTTITFRHPLVRSALYQSATLSQRQRVHAALAAALSGEENTDRRVWHQAMATLTADEEVAAALEASARRAQLRAAHSSAVTAFVRAADLSIEPERRASRLTDAAHAAWAAGEPSRARGLIERVSPVISGQERARLLFLNGVIEARCGDIRAALRILLECVNAASDPSLTLEALGEAAETAAFAGDFATAADLGRRAATVAPTTDRDRFLAAVLTGLSAAIAGDHDRARRALGEVTAYAARLDDPRALLWAASAAWAAPEIADGLSYANHAVAAARERALQLQATALLDRDRFDMALAAAEEGYRLALDTGQAWGTSWHLATMAWVEAIWGRAEEARDHAEQLLALGRNREARYLIGIADWRLGMLHLTEGRPDQAADHLLAVTAADNPESHPLIALRAIPDAVEAAVQAGRQSEITTRLARYQDWVSRSPAREHAALCSRSQALLEPAMAGEHFRQALAAPAVLPPFWRGRTELLYGQWLRRGRQRQEARRHLRAAVDLFHQLRALPWEDRAAAELRATGETVRKRDLSAVEQLTAQELQIAGLVTDGLANAEIAARLFLSPRTVEYHLRKVFTKLGIASRSELIRDGLSRPAPG